MPRSRVSDCVSSRVDRLVARPYLDVFEQGHLGLVSRLTSVRPFGGVFEPTFDIAVQDLLPKHQAY